jgi:hypothetical protein
MPGRRSFTLHVDAPLTNTLSPQPAIIVPFISNCIVPPSGNGDVVAVKMISA